MEIAAYRKNWNRKILVNIQCQKQQNSLFQTLKDGGNVSFICQHPKKQECQVSSFCQCLSMWKDKDKDRKKDKDKDKYKDKDTP